MNEGLGGRQAGLYSGPILCIPSSVAHLLALPPHCYSPCGVACGTLDKGGPHTTLCSPCPHITCCSILSLRGLGRRQSIPLVDSALGTPHILVSLSQGTTLKGEEGIMGFPGMRVSHALYNAGWLASWLFALETYFLFLDQFLRFTEKLSKK